MPHRLQQIVLADHAIAMLDKEGEQIESLGFQFDKLGTATQLAAFDFEPVLAERQTHAPSPRPKFCPKS
jgi:hypothetical protein